jgi:hypothetical protein
VEVLPLKYEPTPEKLYLVVVPEPIPPLEAPRDWAWIVPVHIRMRQSKQSRKLMTGRDRVFTLVAPVEILRFALVT